MNDISVEFTNTKIYVRFFHFSQEIYRQIQNRDCSNIHTEDIKFEFQI